MTNYNEKERVKIAKKEYTDYDVGSDVKIKKGSFPIGTVTKIYDDKRTGLRAIIVKEPNDDLIILYEGSEQPIKPGSFADWVKADIPMAVQVMAMDETDPPTGQFPKPMQLELAAMVLRSVMRDNPKSKVSVYGHSLGSMNAQFALANYDKGQEDRIKGAWLYNGPNIYLTLTDSQQAKIDSIKSKITTYVDLNDPVGLGYPEKGSEKASGLVKRVASKPLAAEAIAAKAFSLNDVNNPITMIKTIGLIGSQMVDQHLWGGYQYNKDGSVKLSPENQALYEQEYARYRIENKVQADMSQLATRKTSLSSDGLTSSEALYLDSIQASTVASGLSQVAQEGEEALSNVSQEAMKAADNLYLSTKQVPYGFVLSPDEVASAYASAGATHDTLVGKLERKVTKKTTAMKTLSQNFTDLEAQIKAGIEAKIANDQELAGLFQG